MPGCKRKTNHDAPNNTVAKGVEEGQTKRGKKKNILKVRYFITISKIIAFYLDTKQKILVMPKKARRGDNKNKKSWKGNSTPTINLRNKGKN